MDRPVYYEDFAEGQVFELGSKTVTRAEIIAFAAEFDPQPFHLDEQSAAGELAGGLIASGWHSMGMLSRMLVDRLLSGSTSMGSPALDRVAWRKPVRPGDTVRGRTEVISKRPSSKPGRGFVRMRHELLDGREEVLMSMEYSIIFATRDAAP